MTIMIDDIVAQAKLVKFKSKCSHVSDNVANLSKVVEGYYAGFMKRDGHLIVLSYGHKYELNRSSWTTYANFDDMYRHNYSNMVSTGAGEVLETTEWHDKEGEVVEEVDVYGYKVTH